MNQTHRHCVVSGVLALIALSISGCVIISSSGCVDDGGDRAKYERTVDLSRPASAETQVEVVNDDGAVVVQGQETSTYTLAATITAHATTAERAQQYAEQTRVDLASESGTIKVVIDRPKNLHNEWVNVDVRLSVPKKIDANLRTSDGRIEIQDLIGTLKAHTSDGSITVRQAQGPIDVQTSDGQIELVCPPQVSATLDASVGDGHISTDLPVTIQGKIGKTLKGQIGKAEGRITLRAGDGSIGIR